MSELAGALAEPTVSVRTPDAPGSVGGDDLCGSLRLGDRYPKARDLLHQHRVRVTGGDGVVHPAGADDEAAALSHLQGTALVAAYPNCVRRVCRLSGCGHQGRCHGSGQEQGQDFSVFHARFLRFVIWWGLCKPNHTTWRGGANTICRHFYPCWIAVTHQRYSAGIERHPVVGGSCRSTGIVDADLLHAGDSIGPGPSTVVRVMVSPASRV